MTPSLRACVGAFIALATVICATGPAGAESVAPGRTAATRTNSAELRASVYEKLARNRLGDLIILVTRGGTESTVKQASNGAWAADADRLCVDIAGITNPIKGEAEVKDEIPSRFIADLTDEEKKGVYHVVDFYKAARFVPARTPTAAEAATYPDDLTGAIERALARTFKRSVQAAIDVAGTGCAPDLFVTTRLLFDAALMPYPAERSWLRLFDRGELVILAEVPVAELRASHAERLASTSPNVDALVELHQKFTDSPTSGPDRLFGAFAVSRGALKPCLLEPEQDSMAPTLLMTAEFKQFLRGTAEKPLAFTSEDLLLQELRKSSISSRCSVVLASGPVLMKLKSVLDREGVASSLMQYALSETRLVQSTAAARGFTGEAAYKLALSLDIATPDIANDLVAAGIVDAASFDIASRRFTAAGFGKDPTPAAVLEFIEDEKASVAAGKTIAQLRAQRAEHERIETAEAIAAIRRREEEKSVEFPYKAVLTCGRNNQVAPLQSCLSDGPITTQVELRNGSDYKTYRLSEVGTLGQSTSSGIEIDLRPKYELVIQNASSSLLLTLVVTKRNTDEVIFQKSAPRFGVLSVRK